MSDAPERIWAKLNYGCKESGYWHDEPITPYMPENQGTEYIRADLARPAPTITEAMALPEVKALVEALQTIKIGTTPEADPDTGDLVEGWMDVDEMQEIAIAALAPFTAAQGEKA